VHCGIITEIGHFQTKNIKSFVQKRQFFDRVLEKALNYVTKLCKIRLIGGSPVSVSRHREGASIG
jgi:hypothetical protein